MNLKSKFRKKKISRFCWFGNFIIKFKLFIFYFEESKPINLNIFRKSNLKKFQRTIVKKTGQNFNEMKVAILIEVFIFAQIDQKRFGEIFKSNQFKKKKDFFQKIK